MAAQIFIAMLALLAFFIVVIGIPLAMYTMMRWSRQTNGRFRNAVGHALEDLDRHTSRPSVENKIEQETKVVYKEDEHGGE